MGRVAAANRPMRRLIMTWLDSVGTTTLAKKLPQRVGARSPSRSLTRAHVQHRVGNYLLWQIRSQSHCTDLHTRWYFQSVEKGTIDESVSSRTFVQGNKMWLQHSSVGVSVSFGLRIEASNTNTHARLLQSATQQNIGGCLGSHIILRSWFFFLFLLFRITLHIVKLFSNSVLWTTTYLTFFFYEAIPELANTCHCFSYNTIST